VALPVKMPYIFSLVFHTGGQKLASAEIKNMHFLGGLRRP